MHLKFRNINDAFRGVVRGIHTGEIPTVVSPSRAGEVLQIEEAMVITYDQPRERVLFNQSRDANPFFHLYESMWMLAGRNTVAELNYYSSEYGNIASDDGVTANGAYGWRWRKAQGRTKKVGNGIFTEGVDQLPLLIEHLRKKPESRRAVLSMWNVRDDLLKIDSSKDVCCNLAITFQIERGPCLVCDGKGKMHRLADRMEDPGDCPKCGGTPSDQPRYVNMTVFNRSNDSIWGALGANLVHFSFLQEYVALSLGLEVGRYDQISANLHAYTERWNPEGWLNDSYPDFYDTGYPPQSEKWKPAFAERFEVESGATFDWSYRPLFPLLEDREVFDREVERFCDYNSKTPEPMTFRVSYQEPFLDEVAQPMMYAFHFHKLRQYDNALQEMTYVKADDWRYAGTKWLEKRKERYERKKAQSEQRELSAE